MLDLTGFGTVTPDVSADPETGFALLSVNGIPMALVNGVAPEEFSLERLSIVLDGEPVMGPQIILGTEGDDVLTGTDATEDIGALDGDDLVYAGDGNDTVRGASGDDTVFGEDGDDHISLGGGNDLAYGGDGADSLYGRDGDDTLYGGEGDDLLVGDAGHDVLVGGTGADTLLGGGGEDLLIAEGPDLMSGGEDEDMFRIYETDAEGVARITDLTNDEEVLIVWNDQVEAPGTPMPALTQVQVGDNVELQLDGDTVAIVENRLAGSVNAAVQRASELLPLAA